MKMIWSESNKRMIHKGFTFIVCKRNGKEYKEHFTWNEEDELYYNDEIEDDYYSLGTAERKITMWEIDDMGRWD